MRARITRALMLVVAAATLSASAAQAQVTTTVVLKSGEQHSGLNLNYRIDRARVAVRTNAGEPTFGEDQVAYVEFANAPMPSGLNLNGQEAVQLRDGSVLRGNLVEMGHGTNGDLSTPFLVIIDTDSGQRRLDAGQVARVYFSEPSANAGGGAGGRDSAITSRAAGARVDQHFTVQGVQAWTATGIQVRRNEQVTIAGSGQVAVGGGFPAAGVTGTGELNNNNPLNSAPTGALIGRIGNGRPFFIGERTTLRATENGQLLLGINDSNHGDNSGSFEVDVVVNPAGRR